MAQPVSEVAAGTFIAWLVMGVVCGGLWGCPQYNVYQQRLDGEAELAKAESTRRTQVLQAQATVDSASKLADADIIRAGGVAKSNQIIGESLKNNEAYLKWLWIDKLDMSKGQTVYIPTEASLPILEAGKRGN